MIMWEGVSFEPQPKQVYIDLLQRGLTQHIRLDEKMIPTAKLLQEAGSPVIMMEGGGGTWPANLAGDPKEWQHQFEPGYTPEGEVHPCLTTLNKGWSINADHIRNTLRKFKDAGVTVDAVWMDWEGDPYGSSDEEHYQQALHCKLCKAKLPPGVLATHANFEAYCRQLYIKFVDEYLAAPVHEIFPHCSVTNWDVKFSTPERPVAKWMGGGRFHRRFPTNYTDTNPVAYGDTLNFPLCWQNNYKLDSEHVNSILYALVARPGFGQCRKLPKIGA